MRGRPVVRNGAAILVLATIAALAALLTLSGRAAAPRPSLEPSASAPRFGGATAHFAAQGYAFDYPATWHFYPLRLLSSHFSVVGYLASQPIDPGSICQSDGNGTSCNFGGYTLEPGRLAIEIADWSWPPDDPVAFWDHPTNGRRAVVDEMPAIVDETPGASGTALTWQVASPDQIGDWIQFDADIRDPGVAPGRIAVEALIQSFRFDPPPAALRLDAADAIGNGALAVLRASDPEAYACFPPVGQRVVGSVTGLPSAPLRQALPALCSTTITSTDIGFWRLELVAGWGVDPSEPTMQYTTVQWLLPDGTPTSQSSGGDNLPFCCRG
jgi:hypothetical protein